MSTASEQEIVSCCFSVAAAVVDELEVCPRCRLSLYLSHSSLTNSNLDFQMSCFGASRSPKEQFLQCCLVFNYLSPCSCTNVQAVARASRKGAGKAGLRDCLADESMEQRSTSWWEDDSVPRCPRNEACSVGICGRHLARHVGVRAVVRHCSKNFGSA